MSSAMKTNNRPKLTLVIPKTEPIEDNNTTSPEICAGQKIARWYDTLIQAREDAEKREAVRIAKKAEATMILGEWNAGKEKDQALIDKIKTEAASRDKMRRAQLKEEKKQKEEVKRAKRNAARKYAREMEKMEKISRKDIRERNRVYKTSPLTPLGPLRRSARLAAKSLAAMRD